jgi:hypothetical protein
MTLTTLRRWAFLEALLVCLAIALVGLARIALYGPTILLNSMLSGDLVALLTLAGLRVRHRSRRSVEPAKTLSSRQPRKAPLKKGSARTNRL